MFLIKRSSSDSSELQISAQSFIKPLISHIQNEAFLSYFSHSQLQINRKGKAAGGKSLCSLLFRHQ